MVLTGLRRRLEQAKAKHHGMTVPQLREHQRAVKQRKRDARQALRAKEQREQQKFRAWKIEQKYKAKRKAYKKRGTEGFTGLLMQLGGAQPSTGGDPFNVFRSPKKTKKRRRRT